MPDTGSIILMLRARDIADLCEDLGFERVSITPKEGWDHSSTWFVAFGQPAYRHLVQIKPEMSLDTVKAMLEAARTPVLAEAPIPAQEAKPSPAATPAPAKGKRKPRQIPDEHA